MKDDEIDYAYLIGYIPISKNGFALPIFRSSLNANAYYIAVSDIEGDHNGSIKKFEIIEGETVILIDPPYIEAKVGGPWVDVFLWNERVYLGLPQQIVKSLSPVWDKLKHTVPLSALDLGLSGGLVVTDVTKLAQKVFKFQLGEYNGDNEFRKVVLRPLIEVEVQRNLNSGSFVIDTCEISNFYSIYTVMEGEFFIEFKNRSNFSDNIENAFRKASQNLERRLGVHLTIVSTVSSEKLKAIELDLDLMLLKYRQMIYDYIYKSKGNYHEILKNIKNSMRYIINLKIKNGINPINELRVLSVKVEFYFYSRTGDFSGMVKLLGELSAASSFVGSEVLERTNLEIMSIRWLCALELSYFCRPTENAFLDQLNTHIRWWESIEAKVSKKLTTLVSEIRIVYAKSQRRMALHNDPEIRLVRAVKQLSMVINDSRINTKSDLEIAARTERAIINSKLFTVFSVKSKSDRHVSDVHSAAMDIDFCIENHVKKKNVVEILRLYSIKLAISATIMFADNSNKNNLKSLELLESSMKNIYMMLFNSLPLRDHMTSIAEILNYLSIFHAIYLNIGIKLGKKRSTLKNNFKEVENWYNHNIDGVDKMMNSVGRVHFLFIRYKINHRLWRIAAAKKLDGYINKDLVYSISNDCEYLSRSGFAEFARALAERLKGLQ